MTGPRRFTTQQMKRAGSALFVVLAWVLVACGGAEEPAPTALAAIDPGLQQLEVLEAVDDAITESYVYSDFGGLDWSIEIGRIRTRVRAGMEAEAFYDQLQALLARLPAGTASLITRQERVARELAQGSAYEGIGVFVGVRAGLQPRMLLLSVMEDSPAARAGLEAHDAVYSVDGTPVLADEGMDIIQRVRGPAGSQVRLEVLSPGGELRDVVVTRGQVSASDIVRLALVGEQVPYLLAPVSTDETYFETIVRVLQGVEEQEGQLDGLVLDLRISGSSSVWPLTAMLTLLGDGEMGFFTANDDQRPLNIKGQDVAGSQEIPLVILVGPDTQGSPEIFAAAMQSIGRATVIGLPTSGRVFSYNQQLLSDGSQLNLAVSTFQTNTGLDLSQSGLIPDQIVESDWDQVFPGFDPLIDSALETLGVSG